MWPLAELTGDCIKGFFYKQMYWMYGHVAKPKKVAVITRWPYYGGGRKAGFHCKLDGRIFIIFIARMSLM